MRHVAYLSIGTNLGDRIKNIEICINGISEKSKITQMSSVYETEPWGYEDDNKYLNVVVKITTNFHALKLLQSLKFIEKNMGRKEFPSSTMYSSRIIDIDILFFNLDIINEKKLVIPHPQLYFRNYVLEPFSEINDNFICPVTHKSIAHYNQKSIDLCQVSVYKDQIMFKT